jgi:copper resistance protein C
MSLRLKSLLAVLTLAGSASLAAAVPHFSVTRSMPAANQVVEQAPARLQYWFSEAPAEGVSTIKLLRGTTEIALAKTVVVTAEKSMHASPEKSLEPGAYKMTWRAAGGDGHVMSGETTFTIAAPKH